MPADESATSANVSLPWWRYGHVWLVIAGPVLVVIAGFWTLRLAITHPDELVTESRVQTLAKPDPQGRLMQDSGQAPAMKARNHAQTARVPVR